MATEYFFHLPEQGLAVCRKCHYAVWPVQALRHLRDKHRKLSAQQRRVIAQDLRTWLDLHLSKDDFVLPPSVEYPLLGVKLLQNGK